MKTPVKGYTEQSDAKLALVNEHKAMEERLLRRLDALQRENDGSVGKPAVDPRWLAIARTNLEQGFMALNRAVFQPERIQLPEDEA